MATDFISDNPALASYYATENNERAQNLGNIQARAANQTEGANNAIDAGIRSWLAGSAPPTAPAQPQPAAAADPNAMASAQPMAAPGPSAAQGAPAASPGPQTPAPTASPAPAAPPSASGPLSAVGVTPPASAVARMAQTPGTGRALMGMQQGAYDRHFQLLNGMFDALNGGDVNKAQALAQAGGLNLPPGALADGRVVRALKIAGGVIPYYKDDPQMAGAYLADALRSADTNGGTPDVAGAFSRNMPRSTVGAKIGAATDAMGHPPSDAAIEAIAGGRLPAPSFGTTIVQGENGPEIATLNRRTGAVAPTGQAAGTRTPETVGTATVDTPSGPQVVTYGRRTGKQTGTLGAGKPGSGATQADRDFTAATNAVNNDPTFIGRPPDERDAEIQRRYESLQTGRRQNNTSARPSPAPAITAPRVDQGTTQNGPTQAGPAQNRVGAQHAGTAVDPHQPQTQADYDAIPVGQVYVGADAQGNPQLSTKQPPPTGQQP